MEFMIDTQSFNYFEPSATNLTFHSCSNLPKTSGTLNSLYSIIPCKDVERVLCHFNEKQNFVMYKHVNTFCINLNYGSDSVGTESINIQFKDFHTHYYEYPDSTLYYTQTEATFTKLPNLTGKNGLLVAVGKFVKNGTKIVLFGFSQIISEIPIPTSLKFEIDPTLDLLQVGLTPFILSLEHKNNDFSYDLMAMYNFGVKYKLIEKNKTLL